MKLNFIIINNNQLNIDYMVYYLSYLIILFIYYFKNNIDKI